MMRQSRYDELYGCTDANKTFLESRSDGRIGKKKKKKCTEKRQRQRQTAQPLDSSFYALDIPRYELLALLSLHELHFF